MRQRRRSGDPGLEIACDDFVLRIVDDIRRLDHAVDILSYQALQRTCATPDDFMRLIVQFRQPGCCNGTRFNQLILRGKIPSIFFVSLHDYAIP